MQSDKPLVHVIDDDQAVREVLRGGGSARPSTSFPARGKQDVDARATRGHDGESAGMTHRESAGGTPMRPCDGRARGRARARKIR